MAFTDLGRAFDDFAENTANPPPNRPIGNAVGQFGRRVCDSVSANPGLYAPTVLQGPIVAACQPYWDGQNYSAPVSEPPFEGGQCVGTFYNITWTRNTPGEAPSPQSDQREGPLGLSRALQPTDNNDSCAPGVTFNRITLTSPQGNVNLGSGCGVTVTDINVTVFGGGVDPCGNPPDEIKPGPNPAPDPGPLPPGTGPTFDVRGNPIIVFPPTVEISPDVFVELPDGNINLGGAGDRTSQPPAPGDEQPGAGGGAGGGDNDFGAPPEGERWCGVCVKINVQPPGAGSIPQAEPESIYPRTIGNVRLKFASFQAAATYDTPIVNRQKTTCVWEPVRGLNPTGVRVNLLPGYSYTFTPYSVPLEN